jgi:hypothetical protein
VHQTPAMEYTRPSLRASTNFGGDYLAYHSAPQQQLDLSLASCYSLHPKKSVVLEFQISCLTIRLIQNFFINIIYFVMTYFIIRDPLIMIYLFYNLYKIFE